MSQVDLAHEASLDLAALSKVTHQLLYGDPGEVTHAQVQLIFIQVIQQKLPRHMWALLHPLLARHSVAIK